MLIRLLTYMIGNRHKVDLKYGKCLLSVGFTFCLILTHVQQTQLQQVTSLCIH